MFIQSEFEFGVANNNAALLGVSRRFGVEGNGFVAHLRRQFSTDNAFAFGKRNVFIVVAHRRFGRWGKQHFRQPLCFLQPSGQGNAAHGAGFLVVFPAAAGQIAAHNRFHFHRRELFHHHRACRQSVRLLGRQYIGHIIAGEMVGHHMRKLIKPEIGNLGENFALARNRVVQNHIKGRQPVGGHHQHALGVDFI